MIAAITDGITPVGNKLRKHSVVIGLGGFRTSISMEDRLWNEVRRVAALRKLLICDLVAEIAATHTGSNLSSAVRLYLFDFVCAERDAALGRARSAA
jgi:predicted DNA-binding ribbon-helix-helix protein